MTQGHFLARECLLMINIRHQQHHLQIFAWKYETRDLGEDIGTTFLKKKKGSLKKGPFAGQCKTYEKIQTSSFTMFI